MKPKNKIRAVLEKLRIVRHIEIDIVNPETSDRIRYNSKNSRPIQMEYRTSERGEDTSSFLNIKDLDDVIERITLLRNNLKAELEK